MGNGNFDLVIIFSIYLFKQEVKISSFPSKRVEYLETSSTNEESRFVDGPGRLNIFEKPKEKIEGKRIIGFDSKVFSSFLTLPLMLTS